MTQIAKRAGISPAAASAVLNGLARQRRISVAVERRVLRAARELDYRPSLVARSLAAKRTMTLGLLLTDLSRSYNPPMCDGIVAEAEQRGYQVVLHYHGEDLLRFRRAWQTIEGWRADGVVLIPPLDMKGTPEHKMLHTAPMPVVLLERDLNDAALNIVLVDWMRAVQMATERLLSLGHKRIALVSGPKGLSETPQREHAFRQTMSDAGLTVEPHVIFSNVYGQDMIECGVEAVEKIFATEPAATALVIINKHRAVGAVRALQARGLRVPQDVSIVTIAADFYPDDLPMRFTNVYIDSRQIGRSAVRMLLDSLTDPTPRRLLIAPSMREGDSTAPPAP